MKILSLLLSLIFILNSNLFAGTALVTFDAEAYSTGANLTTCGWTGTSTNNLEISDAVKHAGSNSIRITGVENGTDTVYLPFTQQTTETFTIDFYYYTHNLAYESYMFLRIADASTNTFWLKSGNGAIGLKYYNRGGYWLDIQAASIDTWYHIEVQINTNTQKMSAWVDNTLRIDNVDTTNATDPDRLILCDLQSYNSGEYQYVDDIIIYSGNRGTYDPGTPAAGPLNIFSNTLMLGE